MTGNGGYFFVRVDMRAEGLTTVLLRSKLRKITSLKEKGLRSKGKMNPLYEKTEIFDRKANLCNFLDYKCLKDLSFLKKNMVSLKA